MFDKNSWLYAKDVKLINQKEKKILKILKLFLNCKYRWGGKTFDGIDCSALIQIYYKYNNKYFPRDTKDQIKYCKLNLKRKNFNNIYCPRDTKDQIKYFKNKVKLEQVKKNDLIFWRGHVAIAISKNKLIHGYGPLKKVVIMPIKKTINRIYKTANLKVIGIRRI